MAYKRATEKGEYIYCGYCKKPLRSGESRREGICSSCHHQETKDLNIFSWLNDLRCDVYFISGSMR